MKRQPWFRMHYEARTDSKLRSLSDRQFRVWFNLLCLSSEQPVRGKIEGMNLHVLAVETADGDDSVVSACFNSLHSLQIVGGTLDDPERVSITFLNFEKRQYDYPSDHPDRVAERMERHRVRRNAKSETSCNEPKRKVTDYIQSQSNKNGGGGGTRPRPFRPPNRPRTAAPKPPRSSPSETSPRSSSRPPGSPPTPSVLANRSSPIGSATPSISPGPRTPVRGGSYKASS